MTALVAIAAAYGVIRTLESQHRPFITVEFDECLPDGKEIEHLLKPSEKWFYLRNSGNSPAIITKVNREWLLAHPRADLSKLRPLSIYKGNGKPTYLVAASNGRTSKLKAAIHSRDTGEHTLKRLCLNRDPNHVARFMVAVKFRDVLGNDYVSHITLRASEGYFHQERENIRKLNWSRQTYWFERFFF